MPKFKANSPEAQVIGAALISMLRSVNLDSFRPILARYGLEKIDPQQWYAQQVVLDIQRDILTQGTTPMYDLVSIGMKVGDRDLLPASSIEQALLNLEASHQQLHRHIEHIGYRVEKLDERHIRVTDLTPYAHDLIYGILYAMVQRHKPPGLSAVVRRVNPHLNELKDPDEPGIYDITW